MKDENPRYRRVVVPLDGSRLAEDIIPRILAVARPFDMQIVLLRVVPPVMREIDGAATLMVLDETAARKGEARHCLAGIAGDLLARGVRVQTRVRCGTPVTEIIAAARAVNADLIAMTTHGRSGLTRLLLGSVAEAILRQGEFPLFVMKLAGAKPRAQAERDINRPDAPSRRRDVPRDEHVGSLAS